MLRRLLIAVLLLGAFGWGLAGLFLLRFQAGDLYEPYSSLRADPLGTKALHDALQELPGVRVERHLRGLEKLLPDPPSTLLCIGQDQSERWDLDRVRSIEALAAKGTRVVIAFWPAETSHSRASSSRPKLPKKSDAKKATPAPSPTPSPKKEEAKEAGDTSADAAPPERKKDGTNEKKKSVTAEDEEDQSLRPGEVADRWGFLVKNLPGEGTGATGRRAKLSDPAIGAEPVLSWHSGLCFDRLQPQWRALYRCQDQPVLIERAYGRGSLVLVADPYFLSNEALRKERAPGLLTWVVGGGRRIVFDEALHGVEEDAGVATLARKYGLHGLAGALLLLALLFIWKSSASFLPPLEEDGTATGVILGRDASEGFIHLLRRSIAPAQLIELCAAEWKKAFPEARKARQRQQIDAVLAAQPPGKADPLTTYRTISQHLSENP